MKEAKEKMSFVRRDRQYGGPGQGRGKGQGGKNLGGGKQNGRGKGERQARTKCWTCGRLGHWAGDPQCPGKPDTEKGKLNEASCVDWEAMTADMGSTSPPRRESVKFETGGASASERYTAHHVISTVGPVGGLAALDSACNRTVVGVIWLQSYLVRLQALGLSRFASWDSESEYFRFGNGGWLKSDRRYRLPAAILNTPS